MIPQGQLRTGMARRWQASSAALRPPAPGRRPRPGRRRGFLGFLASAILAFVAVGCGSGGSPTPGGSPDGDAIAAAFVAILNDPALHANVVQQATATAEQGGDILDLRVSMNGVLALPDLDLEVAVEAEGQATRFRVVLVGEQAFVDLGEGWIEAPPGTVDPAEFAAGFAVVTDADDLAYEGTATVDGRELHHLVATRPLPYTPAGVGAGEGTGTIDDLDAYVEADGTPVRIQLSFTATAPSDAGEATIAGTTELRFSDVDGGQTVAVPSVAPTEVP